MEDMIKRIVDMDQKAREITDSARQEKLQAEDEIAKRAKALREEYLEMARRRIQINAETDRTIFEQKWRRRADQYARQTQHMEQLYTDQHDHWVDEIVRRVLEPDEADKG